MLLRRLHRPPPLFSPSPLSRTPQTPAYRIPTKPTPSDHCFRSRRLHILTTVESSTSILSISIIIAAGALLGGSLILHVRTSPIFDTDAGRLASSTRNNQRVKEEEIMPGAVLPGRPGNLTPEQEVKLRELWTETFRVFGVAAPDDGNGANGLAEADQRSRLSVDKQPKKKRLSMFGKKSRGDGGESSAAESESDDKYGQTKEFHHVIANQSPENLRKAFWSMVTPASIPTRAKMGCPKGTHNDGCDDALATTGNACRR